MRTTFLQTLLALAEEDPRIFLVVGDLGYSVVEPFMERFPKQFLNAGVAEQNMTGVAAGLALSGHVVFTYSIANFPTLRCLEQIRNDVCYHNANVKIIAVGGGMAYGPQGYTHHGVEDLAILRTLPNMAVLAPADPVETRLVTRAAAAWPGPCYLRLEKAGEPVLHETVPPNFALGKGIVLRANVGGRDDVTLVSTGGVLKTALDAACLLADQGVHARVLSLPALKPLDSDLIVRAARETAGIVCVEEHRAPAPLFESVAALVVGGGLRCRVAGINLGEAVAGTAQSQIAYRRAVGLTAETVAARARQIVETVVAT